MNTDKQSYYKNNRLKQMRAFCEVVHTGSMTLAAQRLFLSQPSVTLQIQAMERELGVTVFERRGPVLKLTPDGDVLYALAKPLVEGIDSLQQNFTALHDKLESGELNIGAGESTILYILPEAVRRFVAAYPGVTLKIHNETGRDGLKMLRADEIDFAVGSLLDVPDDITYQPVVTYDPVLITPTDHPLAKLPEVTLSDISQYGLILPPRHLSTWRMVKYVFQQHNLNFTVTLEAGGWEVIKKYVELGMGISVVTDICLTGNENLARIPLGQYFPQRGYGLVFRKGRFLSPQARRFVEILNEVYSIVNG
ncbi:MAG TPA: LysR family transcriptional regulator [Gallionella sp.]|jgi:DNA-binding transcriptional LysR family regulator|nr:LysR family transcriptional regulator [Gallionella sp.]OGS66865.1 MAG: LysR family transcriptional regulator [Gallionellales bacterium GWA2_54_124]OGT29372.1 MAG: LysR family transcriptional regulator [Gallionellales bacterium RIFOXYD2_FULL_52_7]HCI53765.1 LysR family transcriptional regulator [Gallionella sp.]